MSDFTIEPQGDSFLLTPVSDRAKHALRHGWVDDGPDGPVGISANHINWWRWKIEGAGMTWAEEPVVPFTIQAQGEVRNPGG